LAKCCLTVLKGRRSKGRRSCGEGHVVRQYTLILAYSLRFRSQYPGKLSNETNNFIFRIAPVFRCRKPILYLLAYSAHKLCRQYISMKNVCLTVPNQISIAHVERGT
jgi:hypothetical protein